MRAGEARVHKLFHEHLIELCGVMEAGWPPEVNIRFGRIPSVEHPLAEPYHVVLTRNSPESAIVAEAAHVAHTHVLSKYGLNTTRAIGELFESLAILRHALNIQDKAAARRVLGLYNRSKREVEDGEPLYVPARKLKEQHYKVAHWLAWHSVLNGFTTPEKIGWLMHELTRKDFVNEAAGLGVDYPPKVADVAASVIKEKRASPHKVFGRISRYSPEIQVLNYIKELGSKTSDEEKRRLRRELVESVK